jgi:hypothetical protein
LQDTRFPIVPIRPLSHSSGAARRYRVGAAAERSGRVLRNVAP